MVGKYSRTEVAEQVEDKRKRKRRSRIVVVTFIGGFFVLVVLAVTVGVILGKQHQQKIRATEGGNGTSTGGSTSSSGLPALGADVSNFKKDDRLHKVFYGMAYTPEGAVPDFGCSATLAEVIRDVQLMSQLTTRIRLYAADCNQSALVLEAIKQTKVDIQVYLGNYVVSGDDAAYTRQRDEIKNVISKYGTANIAGITVGNEFILNAASDANSTNPNGDAGNKAAEELTAKIADTRQMLADMKLDKNIPVGNSDAGAYFNTHVLEAVDYAMSNVHPWFAGTLASDSAQWTMKFFNLNNVDAANKLANKPKMYIAETGWPTGSADAQHSTNGASDASDANLQVFLDNFVCQANTADVGYFFFELIDEVWKDKKFGGVEGHWGLFDKDYNLKNIQIPTCS